MTGLGKCMSSISVCNLPRCCLLILRPKTSAILVRLPDGAVDVERALAELVESASPIKDQVVAEFDLREEQPVLTAALPALSVAEERREAGRPFPAAPGQVFRDQGVGQFLKPLGGAAPQEGVLLEVNVLLARGGWRASDVD